MDSKLARETRRNPQTHATESNSTQWWARRLIFGVALSAGLVFLNYPLLSSYSVCSPSRNIYTVDDAAPRAECIAVRNARIVRVGSYGVSPRRSSRVLPDSFCR